MPLWLNMSVPVLSFAIAVLVGLWLIPFMKKLHFGQNIKVEDGPKWHASKQGTPIMGGFMFIISSIAAFAAGYSIYRFKVLDATDEYTTESALKMLAVIIYALSFAAMGFADDYIKVAKKRNLGLTAKQKTVIQLLLSCIFIAVLYFLGDRDTTIDFIFAKVDFGVLYYPIIAIFMYYISNAVNITDGVDGLCGSVTVVTMLVLTTVASISKMTEISIFTMALAGGCLGFLIYNLHPAKIFMGDTGSMFLGGVFAAVGIAMHKHLLLLLIGIIYFCEAFSVVLQVSYFKITKKIYYKKTGSLDGGKRIFKMSPIHHHFEMCGWGEYKVVAVFSVISIVTGILAVIAVR